MFKAILDGQEVQITIGNECSINGKETSAELIKNGDLSYALTMNRQTYEADLVKIDRDAKEITLRMKGQKYSFQLKEPIDIMLDQLGMKSGVVKKMNNLKAPMPGLILKIIAEKGKQYAAGEPLLILEAMKMENVFKAAANVTIKDILISEKQSVEKAQVLLEFE